MPNCTVHWVPDSEIKKKEAELADRFKSAETVKRTRGFHNFLPVDNDTKTLRVKQYKSATAGETKKVFK